MSTNASVAAEKSAPVVQIPADVTLPFSSATAAPSPEALLVTLSPQRLALWPEGRSLAVPPPDGAVHGFSASDKRQRSDFLIVPLRDALGARFGADAARPEVMLAVDGSIPYRLFTEVLYSVAVVGAKRVSLLVRSGARQAVIGVPPLVDAAHPGLCQTEIEKTAKAILAALERSRPPEFKTAIQAALGADGGAAGGASEAPSLTPGPPPSLPSRAPLCLNVIPADDGFIVSAFQQRIAPGCTAAGPGVAVPKRDGAYDFAGLSACAARLKERASETDATVSASGGIDLQSVVVAIDALRGDMDSGALFPAPGFGVPR